MSDFLCHKCGTGWESQARQPGVKECCTGCGAYLHCCKNCRHHRPSMHNQCYIPNTDWVGDRAGLNFCDEFCFRAKEGASAQDDKAAQARAQADALLGGEQSESPGLKEIFDEADEEAEDGGAFDKLFGG